MCGDRDKFFIHTSWGWRKEIEEKKDYSLFT